MEEFVGIGQLQIKQPGAHESDPRGYNQVWSNGLTKRELFAAMAMQSLARITPNIVEFTSHNTCTSGFDFSGLAEASVRLSDTLIKELKK